MAKKMFENIRIIGDNETTTDIMKMIIETKKQEGPFHIMDVGEIITRHKSWHTKFPKITPYFAIKSNPNPVILKILASLNANFDCSTKAEIKAVTDQGVSGERIILSQSFKLESDIKFARESGIRRIVADSELELKKIKDIAPDAQIMIRVRVDVSESNIPGKEAAYNKKFGCDPHGEASHLIKTVKKLGLELHGFSFHIGRPSSVAEFTKGINICKGLIGTAKSLGCENVQIINLGGGIPGDKHFAIDKFAKELNKVVDTIDPSIQVINEPGRYFVSACCTSASLVFGKKTNHVNGQKRHIYYTNDGVYGTFWWELVRTPPRLPTSLYHPSTENEKKYMSVIYGPTASGLDCIVKNELLPEYNYGDWMVWENVGDYSHVFAVPFNGYPIPEIYMVARQSIWNEYLSSANLASTQ